MIESIISSSGRPNIPGFCQYARTLHTFDHVFSICQGSPPVQAYGTSQEFSFMTPPSPGVGPVSFFAMADLGTVLSETLKGFSPRMSAMRWTIPAVETDGQTGSDLMPSRRGLSALNSNKRDCYVRCACVEGF